MGQKSASAPSSSTLSVRSHSLTTDDHRRRSCSHAALPPDLTVALLSSRRAPCLPEDIVEEAWNTTLLSCGKRFKGMVESLELDIAVKGGIPRQAFVDARRAKQVITNIVGVRAMPPA